MTKAEMAKLLGVAAAFDNRKVDEAMVEAWHGAIGDFSYDEAEWGLTQHYRHEARWVMPGDVTARIFAERDRQREERSRELAQQRVLEARREKAEFEAYRDAKAIESGIPRPTRERVPAEPVMAFRAAMADMDQMIAKSAQAQTAKPEETP